MSADPVTPETERGGWLRRFAQLALAGNRYGVDWGRFAEAFGMPSPTRSRTSRYWQRRAEWARRIANKRRRRLGWWHIRARLADFTVPFPVTATAQKGPG